MQLVIDGAMLFKLPKAVSVVASISLAAVIYVTLKVKVYVSSSFALAP